MEWKKVLTALTAADGISGQENSVAVIAKELLMPYCDAVTMVHGNVWGTLGKRQSGKPHVLLDAHMDQVGFVVTAITDDGFVRVGNVGGMDRSLMPAQRVRILGRKTVPGVVCCVPPHLQGGEERVLSFSEMAIDTGCSKAELEKYIMPGDAVSFDMPLRFLENGRVTGRCLDDRCGMSAILYALSLVQGEELPCTCTVLFSTQEETGERGATIGAYAIDPDIAIAVDVTFAQAQGEDPTKCGTMGNGPMIGISPALSRRLSEELIQLAKAQQIPWQPEVMAGMTGTNADRFSVTRGGVHTVTVSIPLRYMHTPSELIQISDLEKTGELLAAYLRRCTVC